MVNASDNGEPSYPTDTQVKQPANSHILSTNFFFSVKTESNRNEQPYDMHTPSSQIPFGQGERFGIWWEELAKYIKENPHYET